ncbi:MAG: UDP-2,3-diacylglucosamine diphosphatase [Pseudomonadales bacterium]|nr:UDP-2,3-diacylglucosamine diphosphatase [Pseudomonadales bacterium]
MSTLFISDLHLDQHRTDLMTAFVNFLNDHAMHAENLFILGDFFEVWLGDDFIPPFLQPAIDALAALPIKKYLMHGNRDFLLGEEFCKLTGMTLLNDPTVIDLYGRPCLLMHGDSLCTKDVAYMEARKMLRDPGFQADFLTKTVEERIAFASSAREQSKAHTGEMSTDIMDVTLSEVESAMSNAGVNLMIHGHTHRPATHALMVNEKQATRIVLGDWDTSGWYITAGPGGGSPELVSFKLTGD